MAVVTPVYGGVPSDGYLVKFNGYGLDSILISTNSGLPNDLLNVVILYNNGNAWIGANDVLVKWRWRKLEFL